MIKRSAGQSQPTCHTYLLKIWREGDQEIEDDHAWRFSLEDVQVDLRRGFTDLDSLLIFLQGLTKIQPGPDSGSSVLLKKKVTARAEVEKPQPLSSNKKGVKENETLAP